jgi:hypothetical protein
MRSGKVKKNKPENHSKVLHKKNSAMTVLNGQRKNRRLKRLSDELKELQQMSEFQKKIGSNMFGGHQSAPVPNAQYKRGNSGIQGTNSGVSSNNLSSMLGNQISNGPLVLDQKSANISLGSADSQAQMISRSLGKSKMHSIDE